MSTSTNDQQRAEAGEATAERDRQKGLRLVLAMVAVLVVAAMALGAVLLNRGTGDAAQTDAMEPATEESTADDDAASAGDTEDAPADATATSGEQQLDATAAITPCPTGTGDLPEPTTTPYGEQPSVDLGGVATVRATVSTTCGSIVLQLDAAAAPTTVGNFVALAEDGYYEGVGFHRVIDGFMIQGGDPTGTGSGCLDDACTERLPGYTFADELALAEQVVERAGGYPRGTLAMANAGPDTNGSQFFIVQATPGYPLPPNYAVFGQVVEGMDVVDRIAQGPVDGDLAVDPVVIEAIEVQR